MEKVMAVERAFGFEVEDVSAEKCGWDVTSRPPARADGSLPEERHLEVKGRAKGTATVTVSHNEVLASCNQGDQFILAVVLVDGQTPDEPAYVRQPFKVRDDLAVSTNYDLKKLLAQAVAPEETL